MQAIESTVIVGAGAMGCLFAARLARAGIEVTLVDVDERRLAEIDRQGLTLVDDEGEHAISVRARLAADVTGPVDLVVVFTKGVHTRAAAASVAHLAASSPAVLTLQNGVGNAELIAEAFLPELIVVGTAHVPADLRPPNIVTSKGFAHVGLGGFRPASTGRAGAVAAVLRQAGFVAEISANVEAVIWEKLAFNAALNALAMVTRSSNGDMDNAFAKSIARRLVRETVAVSTARGVPLDEPAIWQTVEKALVEHAHHKASMLQDREARRPTEIDFINGAVVREGLRLGVDTTANGILTDLVKLAELADARPRHVELQA